MKRFMPLFYFRLAGETSAPVADILAAGGAPS
jgi:hypothetical protein